ncbi:MAG: hypothetical protein ACPGUD_07680 [Parashewanella sp.]
MSFSVLPAYNCQLSASRTAKLLGDDFKVATKLSLWDQFKDLFREHTKADALVKYYRLLHPNHPLSVSSDGSLELVQSSDFTDTQAPVDITDSSTIDLNAYSRFMKLRDCASLAYRDRFKASLTQDRKLELSVKGKVIYQCPLYEVIKNTKMNGNFLFGDYFSSQVILYVKQNVTEINQQRAGMSPSLAPIIPADKMQPEQYLDCVRIYLRSQPSEVEQFIKFLDDIGADQTTICDALEDWPATGELAVMQCQFTHFYTAYLSVQMEDVSVQQELIEVISSLRTVQQDNEPFASIELLQRQQQSLRTTLQRVRHSFPHNATRVSKPNY